jgi:hypothetical protein
LPLPPGASKAGLIALRTAVFMKSVLTARLMYACGRQQYAYRRFLRRSISYSRK